MSPDYQADQGRRLFATGLLFFGHGQIWFHASWPGGIFSRHPFVPAQLVDATPSNQLFITIDLNREPIFREVLNLTQTGQRSA
jgi:hypothetical protein